MGRRKYTDRELLEALAGVMAARGTDITCDEYDEASTGNPDVPSRPTLSKRFGSLGEAKKRALKMFPRVPLPDSKTVEEQWLGQELIRFGVVSDTHLGNKWQQLTHLKQVYSFFADEGVHTVYHVGDVSDGWKMRPGHEQELFVHGADAITDYIVNHYPERAGIRTKFITGNHDYSLVKLAGHDIGHVIARERKDMEYLGTLNVRVRLTPNCTLELNHPLDGATYALSYSLQRYIDSLSGGDKPNVLLNGHHHKILYMDYRNIHGFEAGCFCAQTPWMKGKRISAHVGGWMLTLRVDDEGTVRRLDITKYPFYKMVEHDY